MSTQSGENAFSSLNEEKKAQILQDLNQEIERQKAKYLLNDSRMKQSNEIKRNNAIYEDTPQKHDGNKEYNTHIDMLESAKDNLKQIQNDIQNMTNNNYLHTNSQNNDNIDKNDQSPIHNRYGEEAEYEDDKRRKEEREDGEEEENDNAQQYEARYRPYEDYQRGYKQQNHKQQNQIQPMKKPLIDDLSSNLEDHNDDDNDHDNDGALDNNLSDEEPKNLEHELSMSIRNNQNSITNEYNQILTNQSNTSVHNMMISASTKNAPINNNNKGVGGYNFFNPMDYKSNKQSNQNKSSYMERQSYNTNDHKYRDKSFDSLNKIRNKPKAAIKGDREESPYYKRMIKQYTPKYKSKEKYESMKKELESKFIQDHPFKPEINHTIQPKTINETNQARLQRLSQPKIIEIEERMRQKEEIAQQELFANHNHDTHKYNDASHKNFDPSLTSNRLYKLHEQIKEKKEKLKREYEDNKIKEYSFAPNINPESKNLMQKYDQRPIYQRNNDFEKAKNENLLKMRQEIEKEQMSYYKPVINEKSKELAKKNNQSFNDTDIHEKLYRENIRNEKHKHINPNLEECTFAPKLYYEAFDNDVGNIDDFLERQKIYEQLKKERLEKKIIKSNDKNDYTFQPKINITSDILMKTNSLRANEDSQDKIDRLYKQDYEGIQKRKEQLQSFYNAQYDYKPKINELSKFIGREPSLNELNQKSYPTERLNKSQIAMDSECTFKPQINKEKFNHIQSNYKADETIFNRINEELVTKKQKITGIQSVLDKQNVIECKFKPEINKEVPNFETKEPMLMKGMAKHLEQMEKARKAKREKEEREKEVFITGDNWSRDNLITVPKPFKLSYQTQSKKGDGLKKAKEIEMKECTFKPQTNESKNREIIKQLLKD